VSRKKKVVTLEKILYAGPKYFDELTPEPSPARTEMPGQTYNYAPCQKFHSKSSACITTQKYI